MEDECGGLELANERIELGEKILILRLVVCTETSLSRESAASNVKASKRWEEQ